MGHTEDRYIELSGRFVAVTFKDNHIMGAIFRDDRYGKINLNIPYQCILYHDFNRNRAYKLLADIQGRTRQQADGKTFTKNNIVVKRVLQ